MNINWGSGGNSANATATSIPVGLGDGSNGPGSFAPGDIIVMAVADNSGSAATTPAGFTSVASGDVHYFWRICDGSGSDPATSSLAISGLTSGYLAAVAFTVTGASGTDPSWTAWSSGLTAASISPTSDSDLLVGLCAAHVASNGPQGTLGIPAAFTAGSTQSSAKTGGTASTRQGSAVTGCSQQLSASGATGSATFTDTHADTNVAVLLAFSPPPATQVSDSDAFAWTGEAGNESLGKFIQIVAHSPARTPPLPPPPPPWMT